MNDPESEQFFELIVDAQAPGKKAPRLDQYICQQLPQLSRSRLQKLIDEEMVLLNHQAVKASHRICSGDRITIELPEPVALDASAENIPIDIVYEDASLAVINKAAGMVTHPGAGVHTGTLVNALLFHMEGSLSGISGTIRPGIVHRLDKDTSGLIVIAKDDQAHRSLAEQIKAKTARRDYIALLEGNVQWDEGKVDKPIGRHPSKRKQMGIVATGRKAVSRFRVLKRFLKQTLVAVALETGRTHQIRVHMASLNHPVVGDLLYNPKCVGNSDARQMLGLKGHALHAAQLSFNHPVTGVLLKFEAPLPEDFQQLLNQLEESATR